MEFILPSNLQSKLVAYDPVLKKLARSAEPGTTKKSKYHLGCPVDLVPEDILSPAQLQVAIDAINASEVSRRVYTFSRVIKDIARVHAIIYHYESCWYAAWIPNDNDSDKYVYGFAFATRDNAASRKTVPSEIVDFCTSGIAERKQYGKSYFYVMQKIVTKEDICNNKHHRRGWKIASTSYKKGQNIRPVLERFEETLKATIPVWTDENNIFERLECNSIVKVLFSSFNTFRVDPKYWVLNSQESFELTSQSFYNLIEEHYTNNYGTYYSPGQYYPILSILKKPFLRKWIQTQFDVTTETYNDPGTLTKRSIQFGFNRVLHLCNAIMHVNSIWPDCPVDYYNANIDVFLSISSFPGVFSYSRERSHKWIKEHMPVGSYFNIINKFVEECKAERERDRHRLVNKSRETNLEVYYFSDWRDTIQMLDNLIEAGKEIQPPRRWRLNEFHDHVQAEAWKLTNKNVDLPQDLFPSPVPVTLNQIKYTFFQPKDVHQLAEWGRAARNCVGNSNHYSEGVKKKQHFIVLCLVDNKPVYTIQLEVSNGCMSVNQIAGIGNARLTEDEKYRYTQAFSRALDLRNTQLESV